MGARVDVRVASGLLRAHILRRTDGHAGARDAGVGVRGLRDAEVAEQDVTVVALEKLPTHDLSRRAGDP